MALHHENETDGACFNGFVAAEHEPELVGTAGKTSASH
jgi:hypothetical protein